MKKYPISRKDNLVVQEVNGEVLIYDLAKNKAFCLNESSAMIWALCDGTKSAKEISQELSLNFKVPINEELVWLALERFKKENLFENADELSNDFKGFSRREAIRKVGLGSMIALPVVSAIIVPTAVSAQSCTAAGSPCSPSNTTGISMCCNPTMFCNPAGMCGT